MEISMEPQIDPADHRNYQCPVCGLEIARDLLIFLSHGKRHILEILRHEHPEWESSEGMDTECEKYFEREFHGWKTVEEPDHDPKIEGRV